MSDSELEVQGMFEPNRNGGGSLRSPDRNYAVRPADVQVPTRLVTEHFLRGGEIIHGIAKAQDGKRGRPISLSVINTINGCQPGAWCEVPRFEDATVIDPRQRLHFETKDGPLSMRVIDLMMPIGFGQRALIVAAPRTGKTILLQQMAHGIAENFPDAYLMVLLIDERPEEVTEMRRTVRGEVVFSSNDQNTASHVRLVRLMMASAKRRVESGQDVVILLDSLTRLGRAFNAFIRHSGRIMSGGLDIRALEEPKAVFGAARNLENGGSLTIIATALIETGSRMDDVIFSEFKGTGNMEIMLDRSLANKRVWPAIDLQQSGTRKEELLLNEQELEASHGIRRTSAGRPADQVMESLLERLGKHPDNAGFVASSVASSPGNRSRRRLGGFR